jgi:hypothetical protein
VDEGDTSILSDTCGQLAEKTGPKPFIIQLYNSVDLFTFGSFSRIRIFGIQCGFCWYIRLFRLVIAIVIIEKPTISHIGNACEMVRPAVVIRSCFDISIIGSGKHENTY